MASGALHAREVSKINSPVLGKVYGSSLESMLRALSFRTSRWSVFVRPVFSPTAKGLGFRVCSVTRNHCVSQSLRLPAPGISLAPTTA